VTKAHAPGFRSVDTEYRDRQLPLEGTIPTWLSGTLLRNGPGRFEAGGDRVTHWFDGLAMLRRYAFDEGQVTYTNRFLRTEAYADAEAGRLTGQFATDRSGWRRVLSWARSLGPPEPTDNANVHLARIGDAFVALTEAPRRVAFDPETLDTRGPFTFDDDLPEHVTAAHLVDDPHRCELVGFATQFGRRPQYHVYRIRDGTRERIGSVGADGPAYVHDCSVTRDHVVLVEPPLVLSLRRALDPRTEGAIDMLDWQPERGTRLLVVERETGRLVAEPTVDPRFVFHHIGAFEDDGDVVLDVVEYPDAEIVDAMTLAEIDAADGAFPDAPDARPTRYRIDLDGGGFRRTRLAADGLELPRIRRGAIARRHRYAYGQATAHDDANGLLKLDCDTGETREWVESGVYLEEPIPVRRPDADAPDDGVILATALDTHLDRTRLLVFDAATLDLRGEARLPHAEPFGFHGRYVRRGVG
jgi:carotenoid cleavage dioxygenase-like enzyme